MSPAPFSYDAIAEVYATDMGQSMPFDDVGWYRCQCLARGGRALELGCGTGRILLELLAAGVDAIGVDRSLPMLRQLRRGAASRGIEAHVAQMDLRQLALAGKFRTILAPYSLITYVTQATAAVEVLARLRELLGDGGRIVVDAFVPQPVVSFAEFRLDYRRAHGADTLERHKRITANADGTNRIERHYRRFGPDGRLVEEFQTDETIRPYTAAALTALAGNAGLHVESLVFDYGTATDPVGSRFVSALLAAA
jgi:ubiquinone/menaquinone biosynthesis C-methylase UbiE